MWVYGCPRRWPLVSVCIESNYLKINKAVAYSSQLMVSVGIRGFPKRYFLCPESRKQPKLWAIFKDSHITRALPLSYVISTHLHKAWPGFPLNIKDDILIARFVALVQGTDRVFFSNIIPTCVWFSLFLVSVSETFSNVVLIVERSICLERRGSHCVTVSMCHQMIFRYSWCHRARPL